MKAEANPSQLRAQRGQGTNQFGAVGSLMVKERAHDQKITGLNPARCH